MNKWINKRMNRKPGLWWRNPSDLVCVVWTQEAQERYRVYSSSTWWCATLWLSSLKCCNRSHFLHWISFSTESSLMHVVWIVYMFSRRAFCWFISPDVEEKQCGGWTDHRGLIPYVRVKVSLSFISASIFSLNLVEVWHPSACVCCTFIFLPST